MVNVGDKFLLFPCYSSRNAEDDERLTGTVEAIYPRGMFALVNFGKTKECFAISELEQAPRAKR